jgi:hypothetical protein
MAEPRHISTQQLPNAVTAVHQKCMPVLWGSHVLGDWRRPAGFELPKMHLCNSPHQPSVTPALLPPLGSTEHMTITPCSRQPCQQAR